MFMLEAIFIRYFENETAPSAVNEYLPPNGNRTSAPQTIPQVLDYFINTDQTRIHITSQRGNKN